MPAEATQVHIWTPLPGETELFRDRGALAGLRVAYITGAGPMPFVIKVHECDVEEYCHRTDSKGRTPMEIVRGALGKLTTCGTIVMSCKRGVIPGHFEVYDQRGRFLKALPF